VSARSRGPCCTSRTAPATRTGGRRSRPAGSPRSVRPARGHGSGQSPRAGRTGASRSVPSRAGLTPVRPAANAAARGDGGPPGSGARSPGRARIGGSRTRWYERRIIPAAEPI
jgi:hypothetical protein